MYSTVNPLVSLNAIVISYANFRLFSTNSVLYTKLWLTNSVLNSNSVIKFWTLFFFFCYLLWFCALNCVVQIMIYKFRCCKSRSHASCTQSLTWAIVGLVTEFSTREKKKADRAQELTSNYWDSGTKQTKRKPKRNGGMAMRSVANFRSLFAPCIMSISINLP